MGQFDGGILGLLATVQSYRKRKRSTSDTLIIVDHFLHTIVTNLPSPSDQECTGPSFSVLGW
jgi:hypothetical protein